MHTYLHVLLLLIACTIVSFIEQVQAVQVININVPDPAHVIYSHPKQNATYTVKFGAVGFSTVNLNAINVAAEYINKNTSILPDVKIEIYSYSSQVSSDVLFETLYFALNLNVTGLIGGWTSAQSKSMQTISQVYSIPQMSTNNIASSLSSRTDYPYYARTISADSAQIVAVLDFMDECGWKQGVVFYTGEEYGLGYSNLVLQATSRGITLISISISNTGTSSADYAAAVESVKVQVAANGYRIFIFWTTNAPVTATTYMIQAMNASGLLGPEYVYIITGSAVDNARISGTTLGNTTLANGLIGFGIGVPGGNEYNILYDFWQNKSTLGTPYTGETIMPFYSFDMVLGYAYALDSLMKQGYSFANATTGKTLYTRMANQNFTGSTGNVIINNGDRYGAISLWNFYNKSATQKGYFDVAQKKLYRYGPITFNDGTTNIPSDRPYTCASCVYGTCVKNVGCVCNPGYKGSACDVKNSDDTAILKWLLPVIAAILIAALVGGLIYYKKKRAALVKQVAEKQRSIISRSELTLIKKIGRGASGEVWKGSYRGTDVAVKKIITSQISKDVIGEFELEVAMLCSLRHPNIILFMGSCYDPAEGEMLLVMEFMARGSLNDVIGNPNIPMSYEMKLHIACQAAQGMNFLHQATPPMIHHDLKSHNILLDDKWNARISDFGTAKFKEDAKHARNGTSIGTIYWTAPEALDGNNVTEKCDCYSFGIVLWEIFHGQLPYKGRDPVSVAVEVVRSGLRPIIADSVPEDIQKLIRACWAQKPEDRPSFHDIMTTLRSLSLTVPLQNYGSSLRQDAPTGLVYLVATNVIGAYPLWEAIPRDMEQAMKLHNQVVRNNIDLYKGYEVSFENHSFTAAFTTAEDAVNFSIAVQISMLHVEWPAALLQQSRCTTVYGEPNNALLWRGLRVRTAICSGVPNCDINSNSGRMVYFGPVLDKLENCLNYRHESMVVVTDDVADKLTKKRPMLIQDASCTKLGEIEGSARNKMEAIHELNITQLAGRKSTNDYETAQPTLPHVVVSLQDYDEPTPTGPASARGEITRPISATSLNRVGWIVKKDDIEIKEPLGKGPIGDYFVGTWKGREVAVKVLLNQKLKEDDLFKLIGDSAYMSKLNNNNLLPFYGVCLDSGNLTILSELIERGNLRKMLSDQSVQIPYAKKVKLVLSLARGMQFLTSVPDANMQIHDNLKSNNVLVTKDWEVKVADYGHSNIRELARTMTSVGNIAWTAPEILDGSPTTARISTYSFGIIMWEVYTRQVPYVNEHPIRVVSKILSGYRPNIPADCPAPYRKLMEQCVEADPLARPSWEVIIEALSHMDV